MSAPHTGIAYSSAEAWRNIAKVNPHARWNAAPSDPRWNASATKRLGDPVILPALRPSFRFDAASPIFCMGSCFARHIERMFAKLGFVVASAVTEVPTPDVLNKYNTFSMLNELRWALEPGVHPFPEASFVQDSEGYADPHLSFGAVARPLDQVMDLRRKVTESVARIKDCRVIIFTLGLVEVWFDRKAGVHLTEAPSFAACRRDPERYELRVSSYAENMEALEEMHGLITRHGCPDARLVITVSPVPFQATFGEDDVIIANTFSKSTLRAVAGDFCRRHANVDYLPSFESVINSRRDLAWEEDRIHVTETLVKANTLNFIAHYVDGEAGKEASESLQSLLTELASNSAERHSDMCHLPDFDMADPGSSDFPAGIPVVEASSSLSSELGPHHLCQGSEIPWHAATPLNFPQIITLRFERPLAATRLWLQAQDRHPERAPTSFQVVGFDAQGGELDLLEVRDACWKHGGEWQSWEIPSTDLFVELRIILLGCADPSYLTLQRIWLDPAKG